MKVVLFCGGLGSRLRAHTETVPKPMVDIGPRPILWHLMRYYAHFGHRDFVICLGYKGDVIRQYFMDCSEGRVACVSHGPGHDVISLRHGDGTEWQVTLAETGDEVSIGERLRAARPFLDEGQMFLANYSDGLSDLPHNVYVEAFLSQEKIAGCVCVRPYQSFHTVDVADDGSVHDIRTAHASGVWINGGFFAFRWEIFDYLRPGEDLVDGAFSRLVEERQLFGYRYEGFWACMDTLKDKKAFDEMEAHGHRPWQVWASRTEDADPQFHLAPAR